MSEIVIQDFGGLHNGDLSKAGARLMKGASWKRQRTIIVIPADAMIPARCALAMWNLITAPNNGVVNGFLFHPGGRKLLETMEAHPELSAVSGLYWCKGEGSCSQIWGDVSDPILNFRPQIPKPDTVQECVGLGMGFTLFRLSMFKDQRLRRPWFQTQKGAGGVSTQDLFFFSDARKYGYRCAVDTRCKVGHLDISSGVMW